AARVGVNIDVEGGEVDEVRVTAPEVYFADGPRLAAGHGEVVRSLGSVIGAVRTVGGVDAIAPVVVVLVIDHRGRRRRTVSRSVRPCPGRAGRRQGRYSGLAGGGNACQG